MKGTSMAATRKSARSSTQSNTEADGFTVEERAAMKERAKEIKAAKSRKTVDGTAEVLEKIAANLDDGRDHPRPHDNPHDR